MLFVQLKKADEEKHEIVGWAAVEMPDSAGEIMDYYASKKHFIEWSKRIKDASRGKSLGNIRDSHTSKAVGKVIKVIFDDAKRGIKIVAKILDAEAWKKVIEGVFTGFSIGGKYGRIWSDPDNPMLRRYEAIPTEISLVDVPCIPGAVFELVKSDGSSVVIQLSEEKEMENNMTEKIFQLLIEAGVPEESAQALAEKIAALMEGDKGDELSIDSDIQKENQAVLTVDDVKSIVMAILEELGLVSKVGDALAMSAKVVDMEKAISKRDAGFNEFKKSIFGDLAKLAIEVEQLKQQRDSSWGPVLREITGNDVAKAQQAEVLRKALNGIADPLLAERLRNELARLEIAEAISG